MLFKAIVELLEDLYTHNEMTITAKKIRNRLKLSDDKETVMEVSKVLQWLTQNKYLRKLEKGIKKANKYTIEDKILKNKDELQIFYKSNNID